MIPPRTPTSRAQRRCTENDAGSVRSLVRPDDLRKPRRVDVAEHRRARRQERRREEVDVEVIAARRRTVDGVAALIDPDGLAVAEETDNRSAIVQRLAAQFSM